MKIHFGYFGNPLNDGATVAPETIANKVYRYLEARAEVQYYNFMDFTTPPKVAPDDIILGHPSNRPGLFIERYFKEKCKARYLIWPLSTRLPEINRFSIKYAKQADKLFVISGPYWIDTLDKTEYAFMAPKIIRLDNSMALEQDVWQMRKDKFNAKGHRGLLAIGRSGPDKGTPQLFSFLNKVSGLVMVAGSDYTGEDLNIIKNRPNTVILGRIDWKDAQVREKILNQCDFFVEMAVSDPSPTTLLESMSLGLIPIITKQCGYEYDSLLPFKILDGSNQSDNDFNLNSLSVAQNMDEADLKSLQNKNRKLIEKNHTWDKFCSIIWENIQ